MNKANLLIIISFFISSFLFAQEETSKLTYKFSGFVRTDYSFDTRQSVAANEGLFFLYPKDAKYDDAGKDLNAVSNSGFYAFNSRVALDVAGLQLCEADLSAKIEADFAGYSGSSTLLRIRRAFMKMKWEHSSLLLGQEWHPMFGGVTPGVLSLNVGAPFNPFNRSPQITFDYKVENVTFSGSALWEFQYASTGPNGKSHIYQRNANLPEFCLGVNYKYNQFIVGANVDYLTLKPRTQSSVQSSNREILTFKVDEKLSSISYGAYLGYTTGLFSASAKTILGQNPADMSMLGGFGISKIDPETGEQEYTNFKHSSSWVNLSYGKKYAVNIFAGYTKNLGTQDALVSYTTYGEGLNIENLYRLSGSFSYNIPKFLIGLEYEFSNAAYGDGSFNLSDGLYSDTRDIKGHRIMAVVSYIF